MLGGCLRLADQQSFIQNAAGFGLGLFELVAELPKWSRSDGGTLQYFDSLISNDWRKAFGHQPKNLRIDSRNIQTC